MLVALDVQYDTPAPGAAAVGLVAFDAWTSPEPALTRRVLSATAPQAYEPGSFYRRELPFLLEAVQGCAVLPTLVLIDGHVWLDADPSGQPRPGLGAHLHAALGGAVAVVGLAKNAFAGAVATAAVVRGSSSKPLFVTSVGYDLSQAAQGVRDMSGEHRIPKLVKLADQLARGHARTPESPGGHAAQSPTS